MADFSPSPRYPRLRRDQMYAFHRIPFLRFVALALVLSTPLMVRGQERVGTSCADCPNYSGAFSIENETGVTIRYQVKWGEQHPWKLITLNRGHIETHSYPLGENRNGRAPTPYVRFDRI